MMKLSIIIPLYNSEKYITTCINSLLDQDLLQKDYEIIIIDDGSTDRSLEIVKEYLFNYSNIKIHSQKNRGPSVARNKGVQMAKGEFIYFVDSDDFIASNVLKKLVACLNVNIDLLTFKTIHIKEADMKLSNIESLSHFYNNNVITGLTFISKYGYKDAVGWFFVRKQFLIKNHLYYIEGIRLEDISFNLELLTIVKKLLFIPIDVYRYVQRPNSIMTKKDSNHNKKIILDYERVINEFNYKINKYKADNIAVANKFNKKRNVYHFFLFMRLLKSDMSIKDINKKIYNYKKTNLYPLNYYSNSLKVKIMIFIFNHEYFFFFLKYLNIL